MRVIMCRYLSTLAMVLFLVLLYCTSLTTSVAGGVTTSHQEQECPFGLYGVQPTQCICLHEGLWATMTDFCRVPLALKGIHLNSSFCIVNDISSPDNKIQQLTKLLTLKGPEVVQLSASMHKLIERYDIVSTSVSIPEEIYPNKSTLISFGVPDWRLTTGDNQNYCLIHKASPTGYYCIFQPLEEYPGGPPISVQRLVPGGCGISDPVLQPSTCVPLDRDRTCEDATGTNAKPPLSRHAKVATLLEESSLDPGEDVLSLDNLLNAYKFLTDDNGDNFLLSKREDVPAADETVADKTEQVVGAGIGGLLDENEDNIKSAGDEIGHKLMREQIDQYVDTVVSQLTGLYDSASTPQTAKDRFPVLKILNLIRLIMQRTCTAVKSEFFELALNSFLKVQLESFHVKEPYISHGVFVRIDYALRNCYNNAKPHSFVQSNSTCPQMEGTSRKLLREGEEDEIVTLEETPPYAKGILDSGSIREPLIETVWKMLINAHSYCYPYFKAYFNDHHALTVALLPLFNNAIQDIWLKEGGYDVDKKRIYGGLLGDVKRVLEDVDNCVSSSRHLSQYPWYMSRPMRDSSNKWRRRRRRELPINHEILSPNPIWINGGASLCLFDPDDPVAFLGKPVCT